jgi:hypothetical protein
MKGLILYEISPILNELQIKQVSWPDSAQS